MAEQRFDFLRELVKNVPDISLAEEALANFNDDDGQSSPEQDSFSDAASENNKTRPTLLPIDITEVPLDMRKNGDHMNIPAADIDIDSKMRCTRSMRNCEKQQTSQDREHNIERQQRRSSNLKLCSTTSTTSSSSSSSNSVIKHTNALKLMRTESTPESNTIGGYCTSAKRAKQQKSITATCTSESATPAPMVSFDFCSKPVVKIDYSNITSDPNCDEEMPTDCSVKSNKKKILSVPHSAPAAVIGSNNKACQSVFDFSKIATTPNISINIDLSSININATNITSPAIINAATSKLPSSTNNKNIMPKAAIDANLISKPNIATTTITSEAATTSSTSTLSSSSSSSLSLTFTKSTLIELDEDYDNI